MSDARDELRTLTAQFRTRLGWSARWGAVGVPSGPSPRTIADVQALEEGQHAEEPRADEVLVADGESENAEIGGQGACVGQGPLDVPVGAQGLALVREELGDCQRCDLCQTRKNIVFGVGNPQASLVFVGEAPGGDEDVQGEPFVGAAGQLLTKMIEAMGFSRDTVYICNVIKCRPPGNRNPEPDEVAACEPFLKKQLAALRPRVIVALGKFAAHCLLRTETPITRLRGTWGTYEGIATMPTFHPAYLLRTPEGKRLVWQDLKSVLAALKQMGVEPPNPARA